MIRMLLLAILLLVFGNANGQHPKVYHAVKTTSELIIDGQQAEEAWQKAAFTNLFVDIEGSSQKPPFNTKMKMLWDEYYLYVYAYMDEPHIWAKLKERDAVIFLDDDFEIFIDPDGDTHNYTEIEVNALNTVWDLMLMRPYRNDHEEKVLWHWDIPNLKTAVHLEGTINDPSDKDMGWSVEMAIPLKTLIEFDGKKGSVKVGDIWRVNASRVDWDMTVQAGEYVKVKDAPEHNWVWSPQGAINMHMPEKWGYLKFEEVDFANDESSKYIDVDYNIKALLVDLFLAEKKHYSEFGKYTKNIEELGFIEKNLRGATITISDNGHQLYILGTTKDDNKYSIDHTGKLKELNE